MGRLLEDYDRNVELHRAFADRLRGLVVDILDARGIGVHSVACRVKAARRLSKKRWADLEWCHATYRCRGMGISNT